MAMLQPDYKAAATDRALLAALSRDRRAGVTLTGGFQKTPLAQIRPKDQHDTRQITAVTVTFRDSFPATRAAGADEEAGAGACCVHRDYITYMVSRCKAAFPLGKGAMPAHRRARAIARSSSRP